MKILIVVDMQNDFISGSLGTPEAQAIVPGVAELIHQYQEKDIDIFFTQDTHSMSYLETPEGQKLPVEHCIHGEWGWKIADEIMDACGGDPWTITKPTFGSTELIEEFYAWKERCNIFEDEMEIEFCGLCTDICVVSNVLMTKAHFPYAKIGVHQNLCAGVTPESHEAALKTMAMCQIDML